MNKKRQNIKIKTPKLKLKTGDSVQVIAGNHRGKTGKITSILKTKNRVIVSDVATLKKHVKPSSKNPKGGIINIDASIHLSNISLLDPKSKVPTRVGRKLDDKGKLKRYSKKTGQFID